jgi:hypothetical protein
LSYKRKRKIQMRNLRMFVVRNWELFVVVVGESDDGMMRICGDESVRSDEESWSESHERPRPEVGRIGVTS